MKHLFESIPLLGKLVFTNLDNQSLTNCKEVSRKLYESLDKERLLWIRIITNHKCNTTEYSKLWKKAVEKTPLENLKELAVAVDQFFKYSTPNRHLSPREINEAPRWFKAQWSPHHIAAHAGNLKLYQCVVEKTAGINPSGSNKKTVLQFASEYGQLNVCKFIMDGLVDKNPSDDNGDTPFHLAAACGHVELCKLFLENGVDLNCTDKNGLGLLHAAASLGQLETYKIIMDSLQNKNPPDNEGNTPLHIAATENDLELCRIIINM